MNPLIQSKPHSLSSFNEVFNFDPNSFVENVLHNLQKIRCIARALLENFCTSPPNISHRNTTPENMVSSFRFPFAEQTYGSLITFLFTKLSRVDSKLWQALQRKFVQAFGMLNHHILLMQEKINNNQIYLLFILQFSLFN